MRADLRDPVIKELKRYKPTQFAVTVGGEIKLIPLSTKANKWELLLDVLNKLRWSLIEAQNEAGQTLGVVDREIEDEDEDDNTTDAEFVEVDKVKELVAVVTNQLMRVQNATLDQARRMNADANRVFSEMASTMMDGMRAMSEGYQMAIKMTAVAAAAPASAEGGENDAVMKMLQMAVAMGSGRPTPPPAPPQRRPPPPAVKAPVHQPRQAAPTNGVDAKPPG